MDTKLFNGDFYTDERGFLKNIEAYEEILQRCLIRLQIPKGSFLLDRSLGSELKTLLCKKKNEAENEAAGLVQQALEPIREVEVERVECSYAAGDRLILTVYLRLSDEQAVLDIAV